VRNMGILETVKSAITFRNSNPSRKEKGDVVEEIDNAIENRLSDFSEENEDFIIFEKFEEVVDCIDAIISHDRLHDLWGNIPSYFQLDEIECDDYIDSRGNEWVQLSIAATNQSAGSYVYSVIFREHPDFEEMATIVRVIEGSPDIGDGQDMKTFTDTLFSELIKTGMTVEDYW